MLYRCCTEFSNAKLKELGSIYFCFLTLYCKIVHLRFRFRFRSRSRFQFRLRFRPLEPNLVPKFSEPLEVPAPVGLFICICNSMAVPAPARKFPEPICRLRIRFRLRVRPNRSHAMHYCKISVTRILFGCGQLMNFVR